MLSFAERFESFLVAKRDYAAYCNEKSGYYYDADTNRHNWEPLHPEDDGYLHPLFGPGAMRRGELNEEFNFDDVEEF